MIVRKWVFSEMLQLKVFALEPKSSLKSLGGQVQGKSQDFYGCNRFAPIPLFYLPILSTHVSKWADNDRRSKTNLFSEIELTLEQRRRNQWD